MQTIDTSRVPVDQFAQLEDAAGEISPEMRDVVHAIFGHVRNGNEIAAFDSRATFTPNQAAERLGMSRTHIYKLLDRGEIEHDRVGRDRRIPAAALIEFERGRQSDRRQLAERLARQDENEQAAIDELAELL